MTTYTTRDIEMLVARHRPVMKIKDRVKPVCVMTPIEPQPPAECKAGLTFTPGAGSEKLPKNNTHVSGGTERVMISQRYKLEFSVDQEFMSKLEKIKSLLSTKYPKGIGFEGIFDILMNNYLERHAPEHKNKKRGSRAGRAARAGEERRSRDSLGPSRRTRHIPQALRDEIYIRDEGRCTFVGPDGVRCNLLWNLQIDHRMPYAKGGAHGPENLRLLCAKHNNLEAERAYGREFMKKFIQRE